MGHLLLLTATGGLLATLLWLGRDQADRLLQTLLRPALLALMALLLALVTAGQGVRWPYGLIAAACLAGLWESYAGVYRTLAVPAPRATPTRQVQICVVWLINVLANLVLLNSAAQLAYPASFEWRGRAASQLDIAYLTLLTFASGGYGDVVPATSLAKGLVMLTSMAGFTYATILFAAVFRRFRAD